MVGPLLNTALGLLPPRLREKAELKLTSPPIDVVVELTARDRFGNIEYRRKFRSHSFVSNFIQAMYSQFGASTGLTANVTTGKDILGTTRTFVTNSAAASSSSPAAWSGTGANIVVGTSSTTPAFGDNALGGFAGRVFASFGAPTLAATTKFTLTGTITFATATTINEVGVDTPLNYNVNSGTGAASFLLIHDNVSGGFAVSAGGSITVVYTISVTT